jgi:two-component system phosphate regulon sensor histidine kinase PhoR
MTNRRLFSQLFIPSITIIILVIIIFVWFIIHSVEDFYYLEKTNELKARATLVSRTISNEFLNDRQYLTKICQELGNDTRTRITIISDSGDVLGDSHENPQKMDNHNDRPEVINAREKGIGTVIRYSHTLDQEMMYLAIRVDTFKQPLIIRTSLPIASLQSNITGIRRTILLVGILISILAGGISFILSKQIANPLEVMRQRAEQFAKGDFSLKLPTTNTSELNSLANSLNRMTVQLNNRIQTILQERNEREAVLSSMVEGVLAVDTDEKIISLNKAVARLFHIERKPAIGKQISSIIRNSNLLNFIEKVLTSKQYQEAELIIHDTTDRFLNITGTVLHNELGSSTGAVFVLNDITRIKKLENIRQEFVANVSHELKTPITAIKGFIETLRNVTDSADRQRFLDILENQSNRLNAIIDNLLKLSRIEGQENSAEILFEEETIKSVLVNAVADCHKIIEEKNIIIQVKCDIHLSAIINAPLLQQALANLLDNAIKYSDIGDQVIISAKRQGDQVLMTVRDFGIGIPVEHFERLFERFYCVDKARSRKLGGTGLGLAIVKHIAYIHNGNVSVQSEVGKGSTFSIIIPEAK